jgi:hypothetical protein
MHYSGWDLHDQVYSRELLISNRGNGYGDVVASIDLATYRRIPWENNVPFFLVSFLDPKTREPICACPRGTLKKAIDRAASHGWEAVAGVEYEVRVPETRFMSFCLIITFQYFNFKGMISIPSSFLYYNTSRNAGDCSD